MIVSTVPHHKTWFPPHGPYKVRETYKSERLTDVRPTDFPKFLPLTDHVTRTLRLTDVTSHGRYVSRTTSHGRYDVREESMIMIREM